MDEECISDALLADVVSKAKAARQAIRSAYRDPEEAWLDGFLEGWFDGHFRMPPVGIALSQEEEDICSFSVLSTS